MRYLRVRRMLLDGGHSGEHLHREIIASFLIDRPRWGWLVRRLDPWGSVQSGRELAKSVLEHGMLETFVQLHNLPTTKDGEDG